MANGVKQVLPDQRYFQKNALNFGLYQLIVTYFV
jgi:hypothetical protein